MGELPRIQNEAKKEEEKDYVKPWKLPKIKRPGYSPVAFPKSYHELNLLMLWSSKSKVEPPSLKKLLDKLPDVWPKYNYNGNGLQVLLGKKGSENKKGGIASTFFAPNLTMNLTYLCYGNTKVGWYVARPAKTRSSTRFIDEMHCLFGELPFGN